MMELFFILFVIVYVISIVLLVEIYVEKYIDPSFWSVSILLIPILNTLMVIKYGNYNNFKNLFVDSFYNFIKKLE